MILTDDGMTIGWEGDGKSMQSSVYLKKAVRHPPAQSTAVVLPSSRSSAY
jgi:hypothetical protein